MALDSGPASGNAELFLGNPQTAAVEVHVGNPSSNLNPLSPQDTVIPVDPTIGTTLITQTRSNFNFGSTASVRFLNPAIILF